MVSKSINKSASTPEDRENQLINLAMDAAEEQIRNGTASSQIITHFLKLATTREALEKAKLEHENELLRAKTDSINESRLSQSQYQGVLKALRGYKGDIDDGDEMLS